MDLRGELLVGRVVDVAEIRFRGVLARLGVAGASPKYSATWAFTSGEEIQSIHLYMQLGWAAFDETIQVSDHPVGPSLGSTVLT